MLPDQKDQDPGGHDGRSSDPGDRQLAYIRLAGLFLPFAGTFLAGASLGINPTQALVVGAFWSIVMIPHMALALLAVSIGFKATGQGRAVGVLEGCKALLRELIPSVAVFMTLGLFGAYLKS